MDGVETTLYPRYLPTNMPRSSNPVCISGQVIDISENNMLTLDCDPERTNECYVDKQQITVEIPANVEVGPIKEAKFVEVRGVSTEGGDVVLREYTNLKDNFGTLWVT